MSTSSKNCSKKLDVNTAEPAFLSTYSSPKLLYSQGKEFLKEKLAVCCMLLLQYAAFEIIVCLA